MESRLITLTPRRASFLTLGLVALFAVSSCAPAVTGTPPAVPTEAVAPATSTPTAIPEIPPEVVIVSPTPVTEPIQPVATSRGPNLEATDPTTVSLASGGLQLVEFFRFT